MDIRNGGSGCLLWFNDLIDILFQDEKDTIFKWMAASELPGMNLSSVGIYCLDFSNF
jgi:hypothetical protein